MLGVGTFEAELGNRLDDEVGTVVRPRVESAGLEGGLVLSWVRGGSGEAVPCEVEEAVNPPRGGEVPIVFKRSAYFKGGLASSRDRAGSEVGRFGNGVLKKSRFPAGECRF
jgi:hypothetical protein